MAMAMAMAVLVAACAPGADRSVTATTPATIGSDAADRPTSSGPPSTVPRTTGPPATVPPRSFTLAFTGDLLLHERVNALAAANAVDEPDRRYDYRPMMAALEPLVAGADWAVCHLEVNLSADNSRLRPYPRFRAPGDIAGDVRDIGYDSCSTASNHSLDHGPEGVTETLEVLDRAGLAHSGTARSEEEAADSIWIEVGDAAVAHLSYTYWFNGFTVPADTPWLSNQIDESRILADAADARGAGADYVVVSLHWGEQYDSEPNAQQRDLGPRLLASDDIDLIVGHHAHVVQPIERIDGEWLVYGLGNLLSAYREAARRDQLLVVATVTEDVDGRFATELRAVPLYLEGTTLTIHRTDPAARADVSPELEAELDASWARVRAVLEGGTGWNDLDVG